MPSSSHSGSCEPEAQLSSGGRTDGQISSPSPSKTILDAYPYKASKSITNISQDSEREPSECEDALRTTALLLQEQFLKQLLTSGKLHGEAD